MDYFAQLITVISQDHHSKHRHVPEQYKLPRMTDARALMAGDNSSSCRSGDITTSLLKVMAIQAVCAQQRAFPCQALSAA